MKRSEVNKDPERAKKRAVSDFRCAVRKMGLLQAHAELVKMAEEQKASLFASNLRWAEEQTHRGVLA